MFLAIFERMALSEKGPLGSFKSIKMQKIGLVIVVAGLCASSFFVKGVKGEESSTNVPVAVQKPDPIDSLYGQIDFGGAPGVNKEVFRKAYMGYLNLLQAGTLGDKAGLLSICDFSLSANEKRLWVIDLTKKSLLYHSLVAHGQGTGEEYARKFSNKQNSHQSSLGFYVTGETYNGDNGYSLRLYGMDKGYNDAAYQRAIVMHGADYVSPSFIRSNKRLGRSWGCPAIPRDLAQPIINTIREGSCLFVYFPDQKYIASSQWLNTEPSHLGDAWPSSKTAIANEGPAHNML